MEDGKKTASNEFNSTEPKATTLSIVLGFSFTQAVSLSEYLKSGNFPEDDDSRTLVAWEDICE